MLNQNLNATSFKRHAKVLHKIQEEGLNRKTRFYYENHKKNRFLCGSNLTSEEFASQMDKIISVLNRKMGSDWDIILQPVFVAQRLKLDIVVVLYYPDVTIHNTSGLSHEIKDLFISFRIYQNSFSKHLMATHPKGTRGTLTKKEWIHRYFHSHLNPELPDVNRKKSFFNTFEFCIGTSTSLSENIMLMVSEDYVFDDILFESFLYDIDSLVFWESLEGVPYRRISKLTSNVDSNNTVRKSTPFGKSTAKNIILDLEKELFKERNEDTCQQMLRNLKFRINKNSLSIVKNKEYIDFLKFLIKQARMERGTLVIENPLNPEEYLKYNSDSSTIEMITEIENMSQEERPFIRIQDKIIRFTVENDNDDDTLNINEFKIHPKFIDYATKEFETLLHYSLAAEPNLDEGTN